MFLDILKRDEHFSADSNRSVKQLACNTSIFIMHISRLPFRSRFES